MSFLPKTATLVIALSVHPLIWSQPPEWHAALAKVTVRQDLGLAPGSAFVVALKGGSAYLLTAAHVVEGDANPQVTFLVDNTKSYLATVPFKESSTNEIGLAILVVANPPKSVIALSESSHPVTVPGTRVDVGGFPAALDGRFVPFETAATRAGRDLILTQRTDEGYSGGPVLREGLVVGLVYGKGEFGRALESGSLRLFLEGNTVTWNAGSTPSPTSVANEGEDGTKLNPLHGEQTGFEGIWVEKDPANGKPPMRLDVRQNGSQVTVRISYTQVFGAVFGEASLHGTAATWTVPQACAEQFRKPGYEYDNPGVNVFTLKLKDSMLLFEQETKWTVPCDGHPTGTEQNEKTLQRVAAQAKPPAVGQATQFYFMSKRDSPPVRHEWTRGPTGEWDEKYPGRVFTFSEARPDTIQGCKGWVLKRTDNALVVFIPNNGCKQTIKFSTDERVWHDLGDMQDVQFYKDPI